MLGYLSADIICSEKRTVFRERSSRKTVSYEEQVMSKDKYPSIFSPQMATIVFIVLQIFFATREVLKIGEYSRIFPSFICGIFGHVTRLGQSRVSKKIWWIISRYIQINKNALSLEEANITRGTTSWRTMTFLTLLPNGLLFILILEVHLEIVRGIMENSAETT